MPNIFGVRPLKDHEKVRYLKWYMVPPEDVTFNKGYSGDPDKFSFKIASLERAGDFLGLMFLRNQNTILIKIPDDDRKLNVLSRVTAFSPEIFFLINIRCDKPWGESTYIGITKENALKLKLELS